MDSDFDASIEYGDRWTPVDPLRFPIHVGEALIGDAKEPERKNESNAKHWCFTSYRDEEPTYPAGATYAIWQREQCPTTGKLHWQGYIEFSQKKRRSLAQKLIGDSTAHFELRKGTRDQAIAYCSKEDTRMDGTLREYGERPTGEESKSQLQRVAQRVRDGASTGDIAGEEPTAIIRYGKGITALIAARDALQPMSYRSVRVLVVSGPPGCGKTKWAFNYISDRFAGIAYNKVYTEGESSWWDGYAGHKCIFIDDFEGAAPIEELLHLLGGYGHNRQYAIKGGFVRLDGLDTIIFTSNSTPESWYMHKRHLPRAKTEALLRRITWQKAVQQGETFEYDANEKYE